MSNLDHIVLTAIAVAFRTIEVGTPPARLALTTYGKGHLLVGKQRWAALREKAAKGKGAKAEKGKVVKGVDLISEIWEIEHQLKMEEMESVTIGHGEMGIANLEQTASLNMKDRKAA